MEHPLEQSRELSNKTLETIKLQLEEKDYVVIPNILSSEEDTKSREYFFNWYNANPQIKYIHEKGSHGIMQNFQDQRHDWFIRTRTNVMKVFKYLWNTDNLLVSYDECCWMPREMQKKDSILTHIDQAPSKKGLQCYQGLVSLTSNKKRTLVVYKGSHLLHDSYCSEKNLKHSTNWQLIDVDYLLTIADKKRVIEADAGWLIIWDSRSFHQNQYASNGSDTEERLVQYVSYLPKIDCSEKMLEKLIKYFNEFRTTSHWAYPLKVNGLQPQAYKKPNIYIDYSQLKPPDLEDLMPDITKLVGM